MISKRELIEGLSFGQRIAEDEAKDLTKYFVETDLWKRLKRGEVDVVYGPKGSGKSALYSLLNDRSRELSGTGTILISAENPKGASAFSEIQVKPPTSEQEFIGLWKLYILCLIVEALRDKDIKSPEFNRLVKILETEKLIQEEPGIKLRSLMTKVINYAKKVHKPQTAEGGLVADPNTGAVGFNFKIIFREPQPEEVQRGQVSIDSLLEDINDVLEAQDYTVWILLDRLDVAFEQSHELENNALRALFRAYRDLSPFTQISLKIFLRSDIWTRITSGGFREASHITKARTIEWKRHNLVNLVVRRLLANENLCEFLNVDPKKVLDSQTEQEKLLERVLPLQVDNGSKKSKTFDWMLNRTKDGTGTNAPRELIHLLSSIHEKEVEYLELGNDLAQGDVLFDRSVFKSALMSVSKERLTQNLYAEYDDVKPYIEKLRGQKTHHDVRSLADIWKVDESEAQKIIEKLVEIGFFEQRDSEDKQRYWVPFLYRDALEMVQGTA